MMILMLMIVTIMIIENWLNYDKGISYEGIYGYNEDIDDDNDADGDKGLNNNWFSQYHHEDLNSGTIKNAFFLTYFFSKEMFLKVGVLLISPTLFYRYLRNIVYPVLHLHWLKEQAHLLSEVCIFLFCCN